MPHLHRRTAPRVRNGRVQKKNRTQLTPRLPQSFDGPCIDRGKPGSGYRHVLLKRDVTRFIKLLPDWNTLSVGLRAILIAPGERNLHGWHRPGIVAVCAWYRDLWYESTKWFHDEHIHVYDQIGLEREEQDDGYVLLKWTVPKVRAFQLLHILLHELGHHHDRMTTRKKRWSARGEDFAENYAVRYADRVWENYIAEFGMP